MLSGCGSINGGVSIKQLELAELVGNGGLLHHASCRKHSKRGFSILADSSAHFSRWINFIKNVWNIMTMDTQREQNRTFEPTIRTQKSPDEFGKNVSHRIPFSRR